MAQFLAWACHPDGQIPLLNDSALNGAMAPREIFEAVGAALTPALSQREREFARAGGRWFEATGLVVWHGQPWSVLFDVGPLGPDFQPGHGHADSLTLEASYRGARLLVDAGTFGYDDDACRAALRGTAAHNTITIDQCNSSEVWGIFRVGRRARPRDVQVEINESSLVASAQHDGYDHMPGCPRHRRRVEVADEGPLRVVDSISGTREHAVAGGWLLAPGWQVASVGGGWRLDGPGGTLKLAIAGNQPLQLAAVRAEYCPQFGAIEQTMRLEWQYQGPLPLEVTTIVEEAS
jgi:hypothetical protein